ncbi:MAG: class F sortase [Actinomycetales bacterium]
MAAGSAALAVVLGVVGLSVHDRSRATGAAAGPDIGSVSLGSPGSAAETGGSANGAPTPAAGGLLATHSTELGAQGDDRARPTAVSIPRLHLRAATTAAGVGPDNRSLSLLPSARAVVWWAYGATPGAASGTVLFAGHVSWSGRAGVLADLRLLRLGDEVTVARGDGTVVRYQVTGRRRVPKQSLDQLGVFTTGGPPRLVLVTCGGRYDAARRSYEDNVVVQARPL